MKSSRSISNWKIQSSYGINTPRRAKTPNRILPSGYQNHSMLPPNRMNRHKNSLDYRYENQKGDFSQMISGSMDPRALKYHQQMSASYYQNNFYPGFDEQQFPGILNRFSLSRVNNK